MTRRTSNLTPYLLVLPALAFMALFFAYPMVEAFGLAFRDADTGAFTLANFTKMAADVQFSPALGTTLLLIVVIIPVQFFIAMVMALVVNARLRGAGFFLYVYAIPLAISELAAGIVWFNIFTDRGFLNSLLTALGILERPFLFLSYLNRGWLLCAVVLAEAWRAVAPDHNWPAPEASTVDIPSPCASPLGRYGAVGLAGATLCNVYCVTFSRGVRASKLKLKYCAESAT